MRRAGINLPRHRTYATSVLRPSDSYRQPDLANRVHASNFVPDGIFGKDRYQLASSPDLRPKGSAMPLHTIKRTSPIPFSPQTLRQTALFGRAIITQSSSTTLNCKVVPSGTLRICLWMSNRSSRALRSSSAYRLSTSNSPPTTKGTFGTSL